MVLVLRFQYWTMRAFALRNYRKKFELKFLDDSKINSLNMINIVSSIYFFGVVPCFFLISLIIQSYPLYYFFFGFSIIFLNILIFKHQISQVSRKIIFLKGMRDADNTLRYLKVLTSIPPENRICYPNSLLILYRKEFADGLYFQKKSEWYKKLYLSSHAQSILPHTNFAAFVLLTLPSIIALCRISQKAFYQSLLAHMTFFIIALAYVIFYYWERLRFSRENKYNYKKKHFHLYNNTTVALYNNSVLVRFLFLKILFFKPVADLCRHVEGEEAEAVVRLLQRLAPVHQHVGGEQHPAGHQDGGGNE